MLNRVKSKINSQLYELKYTKFIPVQEISEILKGHGVVVLDFSEFIIFCGRSGRETFDMYIGDMKVENSLLVLSWYKVGDMYEIVSYVS